jgi:hypothetical protein
MVVGYIIKLKIVIHFGMNPINGGNPPSDRSIITNGVVIFILLFIDRVD